MNSIDYFSDRERGARPRIVEEITAEAWGGIIALLQSLIDNDSFAADFRDECPDGRGPCGTNKRTLALAIRAEIPELNWPLEMHDLSRQMDLNDRPSTLAILDLIEFCHRVAAKPIQRDYHEYYSHWHLTFEREQGQRDFRQKIERVFARNSLAYELQDGGHIVRSAPPVLQEALRTAVFRTDDAYLDSMLESALSKYLDPDPARRRESLEKLWDAWERLKTLEYPDDKKKSVAMLLEKASAEENFRIRLNVEAAELTEIGNRFMIRHTEKGKTPVTSNRHVDYLFQRLFALIQLLLKSR